MKKYYFGVSVRKKKRENIKLLIPLFLTEPKTGRTRYPTCTKTILGPSLFCAQPVRQMVHGNDPLQSPAHSNRLRCLHTHTDPCSQSVEPSEQDPPDLTAGSANRISGWAEISFPSARTVRGTFVAGTFRSDGTLWL